MNIAIAFVAGLVIGQIVGAVWYLQKMTDDVPACEKLLSDAKKRAALRRLVELVKGFEKKGPQ